MSDKQCIWPGCNSPGAYIRFKNGAETIFCKEHAAEQVSFTHERLDWLYWKTIRGIPMDRGSKKYSMASTIGKPGFVHARNEKKAESVPEVVMPTTEPPKEVIVYGYVRVSTLEQKDGYGTETQTKSIKDYCQSKGLIIHDNNIREEVKSGHEMDTRKVFGELEIEMSMKASKGHEVHVVFPRLDRVARNLTDSEAFIMRMIKAKINMHSCVATEHMFMSVDCRDDPLRLAFRQIVGVFSELEHGIIKSRLLSGRKTKSKGGGFSGGRLSFGYKPKHVIVNNKKVASEIMVDEKKAEIIRFIFAKRAEGWTIEKIGFQLDANPEWRGVMIWTESAVNRVLGYEQIYRTGVYKDRMGGEIKSTDLIILK